MAFNVSSIVQLREARVQDDNWTGLANAAERRKRQNRLHQRAWRRKKAAQRAPGDQHESHEQESHEQESHRQAKPSKPDVDSPLAQEIMNLLKADPRVPSHLYTRLKPFTYWEEFHAQLNAINEVYGIPDRPCYNLSRRQDLTHGARHDLPSPKRQAIPPMIPYLDSHNQVRITIPDFAFPLSADHRLLVLIQYNVLRAFITNMSILSIIHRMPLECGIALKIKNLLPPPKTIPPNFESTQVQTRVAHDFWIDIVPWSGMRDNLILNHGRYDEEDLCVDMAGGLYEGFDEIETRGLIVWGEPWSETGWEVTEGFAKKWSFLLKGCHTLIESTNRWRESRGEEKLIIEV